MRALRLLLAITMIADAGRASVIINQGDVGTAITIDYFGQSLGFPVSGLGAIGNFVYTGASNEGRSYNFSYALTNDSSIASRVRSFGFDVLGSGPSALSSTGTYTTPIANPLSGLIGSDLCFTVSTLGGCGTGSGGLSAGQSGSGTFTLTFAQTMASVELANFGVNFQGVNGLFAASGTGDAVVTPTTGGGDAASAAPDGQTWMMMIAGFALIGWSLRRSRRSGRVAASLHSGAAGIASPR